MPTSPLTVPLMQTVTNTSTTTVTQDANLVPVPFTGGTAGCLVIQTGALTVVDANPHMRTALLRKPLFFKVRDGEYRALTGFLPLVFAAGDVDGNHRVALAPIVNGKNYRAFAGDIPADLDPKLDPTLAYAEIGLVVGQNVLACNVKDVEVDSTYVAAPATLNLTVALAGVSSATVSVQDVSQSPAVTVFNGVVSGTQIVGGLTLGNAFAVTGAAVSGFTAPATQNLTPTGDTTTTLTYTAVTYSLTITVSGTSAAPVTVLNTTTGTGVFSGVVTGSTTLTNLPGGHTYSITGGAVSGLVSPAVRTVTLNASQTVGLTYAAAPTASLTVIISGPASAPVTITNTTTNTQLYAGTLSGSRTWSGLRLGDGYMIVPGGVSGYTTPANQTLALDTNRTSTLTYAAIQVSAQTIASLPIRDGQIAVNTSVAPPTGAPYYVDADGNYRLRAGYHYRNTTPGQTLFLVTGDKKFVVESEAGKPIVLTVNGGNVFSGFGNRLHIRGVLARMLNPNLKGKPKGRFVNGQEIKHLVCWENDFDGTGGIYLTGKSNATSVYAKYQGIRGVDKISILRNICRNVDGRVSSGTGTGDSHYIKSTTGDTHTTSTATNTTNGWRWNPATPISERTDANKSDPTKYSPTGWYPRQFVQISGITQHPDIEIGWNMILSEIGKSRPEDLISMEGGSGGTQGSPHRVHHNYGENLGGWDPFFTSGTYNNSNQYPATGVTPDGYQSPSHTLYSGSFYIHDGRNGVWADNSHYGIISDNWAVGQQIQVNNGSYNQILRNRVYALTNDSPTVSLGYRFQGFYIQSSTATATDGTTSRLVSTGNVLRDNTRYDSGAVSGQTFGNTSGVATADKTGNTVVASVGTNGKAELRAQFLAWLTSLGVTPGIPADRRAA